jgi:putative ABC transport system ATP-binding protein
VARALAHEPRVLFADEPTGSLDDANSRFVLDELVRLARECGAGVVMVTHDREVAEVADRRLTMRDGQFVADGAL